MRPADAAQAERRKPAAAGHSPAPPPAERIQSAHGLDAIFSPRSAVVVGASPNGGVGRSLLDNVVAGGYRGRLAVVHPAAKEVAGVPAVPAVERLDFVPDLAVLAVPAAAVRDVAEACGRKGVRGLVVISAGFAEAGAAGLAREAELRSTIQRHGMRMVGPNCLGIANTDPATRLNAVFGSVPVEPGRLGLVTQSGAVGVALLEQAHERGLGVARFASMGNKTDVSGNDLLLLFADDPGVHQVLFYLESFGNPRNFLRIARQVSRRKPVLAVKAGRTPEGQRAAASHTAALAAPDRAVDALLDQAGVLRVDSVGALFDAAQAADKAPLPIGNRVAVVTNSGGPAILATDALAAAGLKLAQLSPKTLEGLAGMLPVGGTAANPLDLLAAGDPAGFERAVALLLADPGVDALLAIATAVLWSDQAIAQGIARGARTQPAKPTLAVAFGAGPGTGQFQAFNAQGLAAYPFPESAVRALGHLRRLAELRARPTEPVPALPVDRAAADRILSAARPGWLPMRDALAVATAYGLPVVESAWAPTVERAAGACFGQGPWALKAEAPGVVHKTEAKAVRLGLRTPQEVGEAAREMQAALAQAGHPPEGFLVMRQAPPGQEILLGAKRQARFGNVLAFGLGGIHAELLDDVAVGLAPLSRGDARRMMESIRARKILDGWRGHPPLDRAALEDALLRLSQLVEDHPSIAEMDVNPMFAYAEGKGVVAVDVRIRVDNPTTNLV